MIDKASNKDEMTVWLDRLFNDRNKPEDNLFRGVTTNTPLSYNAIKDNPEYWAGWIDEYIKKEICADVEVVFRNTSKEIVKRGTEAYMPLPTSSVVPPRTWWILWPSG